MPRGHCAPHSRAGRSSPAPRRRPQEPTINRVRKTSFKKPWKVSCTVSNKVWVLILSSPLLPELKGPEERVVAFITPPSPRTRKTLGAASGTVAVPGEPKVGRRVAPQPGGSGWPMTRSFARVNTLPAGEPIRLPLPQIPGTTLEGGQEEPTVHPRARVRVPSPAGSPARPDFPHLPSRRARPPACRPAAQNSPRR